MTGDGHIPMGEAVPPGASAANSQIVHAEDGVPLWVEVRGEGDREFFLCNGLYCSVDYYGPFAQHFSKQGRVVRWDYRGHGKSGDPADPTTVTLDQLTRDAARVFQTTVRGGA